VAVTTIPILPSADFDVTRGFWAAFGFEESGRWSGEYLILRHPGLGAELHFWMDPDVDRWTNDVACYVRFADPDGVLACHAAWGDVAVPDPGVLSEPRREEDGAVEFHVIDLHGNLVRVGGFPPRV
jgi:hypothetical protein